MICNSRSEEPEPGLSSQCSWPLRNEMSEHPPLTKTRMASSVIAFLIAFAIIMSLSQPMTAATTKLRAQKRDFLTMKEIEKLQEAQRIDLRVKLLVGSADIRFALLGARPMPKRSAKDWGEPPSGTREELLRDIDRIIMKAIDDLGATVG